MLKMVARKKGTEEIHFGDSTVKAEKVIISLPGFKGLFWKITYWYRKSDGTVIHYMDSRGGPGTPETIGTLVYEENTL